MTLENTWQVEQTWGSHQPILKAVLEVLKPSSVVECGCGNYSTPLLRSSVSQLLTLEHDVSWAHRIMKDFPEEHNKHHWKIYNISGHNETPVKEIPLKEVQRIRIFYEAVEKEAKSFDLLVETLDMLNTNRKGSRGEWLPRLELSQ